MNLSATKQITNEITVSAEGCEIQIKLGQHVEYVWFCNAIEEARHQWVYAVAAAKRLAGRLSAA